MKKLILLTLLIGGCDYAPTEHSHDTEHEHKTGVCVRVFPSQSYYYSGSDIFADDYEGSWFTSVPHYFCYRYGLSKCVDEMINEEYESLHWEIHEEETCEEVCESRGGIGEIGESNDIHDDVGNCFINEPSPTWIPIVDAP